MLKKKKNESKHMINKYDKIQWKRKTYHVQYEPERIDEYGFLR